MNAIPKTSDQKHELVPTLRFSDFRDAREWQVKQFAQLFSIGNGRDYKHLKPGNIPVYGSGGYMRSVNEFLYDGESVCIGRKGTIDKPIFLSGKFWTVDTLFYTHSFTHCLPRFVHLLFQRVDWLKHNEAGGIPSLSKANIEKIRVAVPERSEQQKLVDCFSSLDNLIMVETQKLDALKNQKKGLTQRLFPCEGEAFPRLRLPKYASEGEWKEHDLGEKVIKIGSGITPTGGEKTYKAFGRPFVRSQNIGWGDLRLNGVAFIDEQTHKSFQATELRLSDVLLNITGASIGRSAIADSRIVGGNVNQHVCIIRTTGDLSPSYLNQYLISQYGQWQIDSFQAGGNRQGLNFAQVRSFRIPLPPHLDEQKSVAALLSSLDDLITAQSHKITALEIHKKGLLQRLFPVLNEVPV